MEKSYDTPVDFDRAIKRAVRESGIDAGEGYRQALRDRFLCRVFTGGNEKFILKGGSGMLARIPDARATKDLDFAVKAKVSADDVLSDMKRIAAINLHDWCRFVLTKHEESMDENGYSRLLKLRFATYIGGEEKDPVIIDLSLDCETTLPPERIKPANRIYIEGIETCEYLAYSLPDQLADKFSAIVELQPGGYPSSRMKDLVDVVTYATNKAFSLRELRLAIRSECARRNMEVPERFDVPEFWRERYGSFAKGKLPSEVASFDASFGIASDFFSPALGGIDRDLSWNPSLRTWL